MRSALLLVVYLLIAASARAGNLPDAPTPQAELITTEHHNEASVHLFYNREALYTLVIEGAAWAGDMAIDLRESQPRRTRSGLPSQHFGPIIGMTLGFTLQRKAAHTCFTGWAGINSSGFHAGTSRTRTLRVQL